jgi:hypothetical protein
MAGEKAGNPKWVKGQSGNPGGRPKADYRIKELAKEKTPLALNTLAYVCEHGENEGARVAAAEALLNRGWGKPTQTIEANVTHAVAADMTDEELIDIARRSSDGAAEEAGGTQDAAELH